MLDVIALVIKPNIVNIHFLDQSSNKVTEPVLNHSRVTGYSNRVE